MFNYLVTAGAGAWDKPDYRFDITRFLKYTPDDLVARLKPPTDKAIAELVTLPTIFAYETHVGAPARIGWLKTIQARGDEIRITFAFDSAIAAIEQERLQALSWDLDLTAMNHTHWAVKERDLLKVLQSNGLLTAATPEFRFTRQTLLKASAILRTLGHTPFDHFVLELGIPGLKADRDLGGLQGRANALGAYIIDHASEPTADGEPLGLAVVKRAIVANPSLQERDAFYDNLRKDGYAVDDGNVVAQAATEVSVRPPYAVPAVEERPPTAPKASAPPAAFTPQSRSSPVVTASPAKVFIVHGRDNGAKHEVARFLERLGIEPVILHERPNKGRTLISKFQEESADIRFAVVLMTPDDVGGVVGGTQQPRARQNVIFELGFFLGQLGADRVCALFSGNIERPSDFEGVVYVEYGTNTAWKTDLAREL